MQLSDTLDLAILLGRDRYPSSLSGDVKVRLLADASAELPHVDTLLLTSHRDSSSPNSCVAELIALRGFRPFSCPAHPMLRRSSRGGAGSLPGRCTCTVPERIHCQPCTSCSSGQRDSCRYTP